MRQGQQNRRGRGRNRKGQSPLARSFESTGPDVKIRGTPAHIAEKYMTLARDATSSGDPVLAENYLQHAEHYFRIISSAQAQSQQQQPQQPPQPQQQPQPTIEQPGAEINGAPREPIAASPSVEETEQTASAEPSMQTDAEDSPRKPRRRRGGDGRAHAANGHDAESEISADGAGAGEEDAQGSVEDTDANAEKPVEPAV
jgi:Domain of unknown function (DUF4167)